jgi:hypothetical protein
MNSQTYTYTPPVTLSSLHQSYLRIANILFASLYSLGCTSHILDSSLDYNM